MGCIHYGVLETEAAFAVPAKSGGLFLAGAFALPGTDGWSAWNELDMARAGPCPLLPASAPSPSHRAAGPCAFRA